MEISQKNFVFDILYTRMSRKNYKVIDQRSESLLADKLKKSNFHGGFAGGS